MKKISVFIPCYNEEGNVREMAETLTNIFAKLEYEYELLFVDNCSKDNTKLILREIAEDDKRIKVLFNNRNYGTDGRSAFNAFKYITGDVLISIACDFQEPPELIPEFISNWESGYKVVCGQKTGSKEGVVKFACRSLYYSLLNTFSEVPLYKHISGIVLIDREVLDNYIKSDYDYELRFAISDMGYDVKLIPYKQQDRKSGKSSYNVWRYLSFAIRSMVTSSNTPIRLMTIVGVIFSIIAFLVGVVYLIYKLIFWDSFDAGMAPVMIGMFFLGAVQIMFLGIIGEYIGIILKKVSNRPDVVLEDTINVDKKSNKEQSADL